jgi:hypothetical protein
MSVIRRAIRRLVLPRVAAQGADHRAVTEEPFDTQGPNSASLDSSNAVDNVIELIVRVWESGTPQDVGRLSDLVRLSEKDTPAHVRGTLGLARWDLHAGRVEEALASLEHLEPADPTLQREVDLLRIDCLLGLGQARAALTNLSRRIGRSTSDRDLILRSAHARFLLGSSTDHGSGPFVEALNAIYGHAGLGMLRRESVAAPTELSNLWCGVPTSEPREALPRVTILTSLRNPADLFGLRSLVSQSWTNLEILVLGGARVHDDIADELGRGADVKFLDESDFTDHPLAVATRHATGEFVGLHPPGSWAHPQRVEAQASALVVDSEQDANVSAHMRVRRDLVPQPLGRAALPELVGLHPSTIMFRLGLGTPVEVLALFRQEVLPRYCATTGVLRPLPERIGHTFQHVPLSLSMVDFPLADVWSRDPASSAVPA